MNAPSKILESIIKEEKGLLPHNQFGFRTGLSATQQAMHLASAINRETRPRSKAAIALFDLEKAYDKVWRSGLLLKLEVLEIPFWIRFFRVRRGDQTSEWRLASEGLPQGSPLSPYLFNMFVGDLPRALRFPRTQVFQFADDMAILTAARTENCVVNRLEAAAGTLVKYFEKWKMSVNAGKTEVMFPGIRSAKDKVVRIGKSVIKVKRKVKYLGVVLDRKGTMEGHVRARAGLAKLRLRNLFPG